MKNKQVTFMLVVLSFLLMLGFSSQALAGETYKMGLSLAITGPTSDVGSVYSKGVEDYCKYVNDEKLLGDDKLVCFIRDDGYKTEVTKRNFEDFLDENIVFYLNYSTGSTLALRPDFEEEKIPVVDSTSDREDLPTYTLPDFTVVGNKYPSFRPHMRGKMSLSKTSRSHYQRMQDKKDKSSKEIKLPELKFSGSGPRTAMKGKLPRSKTSGAYMRKDIYGKEYKAYQERKDVSEFEPTSFLMTDEKVSKDKKFKLPNLKFSGSGGNRSFMRSKGK